VRDLAVTHQDSVVRKWRGDLPLEAGVVTREVEIEMNPAGNRVTAYAFRDSDLRSTEAVWEKPMQGFGYAVPQRTLHALAIGVGKCLTNDAFVLTFTADDVKLVEESLRISETDL
jgi:hypothetical protein